MGVVNRELYLLHEVVSISATFNILILFYQQVMKSFSALSVVMELFIQFVIIHPNVHVKN